MLHRVGWFRARLLATLLARLLARLLATLLAGVGLLLCIHDVGWG